MLFEFVLRPIEDVQPWGKYPDVSLSWFALTDGFFRIRVGNEYLLHSSNEEVQKERLRRGCPHPYPLYEAWTDYQVVRLWEDTLESLPSILQPLPEELCRIVELDWAENAQWHERISEHFTCSEQYNAATQWIGRRDLCSAGAGGGGLDVWSYGDQVHIRWYDDDNGERRFSHIPRRIFLKEVYSFHDRLMTAMQQRVEAALEIDWKSRSVELDLYALWEEQAERRQWLSRYLNEKIPSSDIEDAVRVLAPIHYGIRE